MRTYLILYTESRIWMVELVVNDYAVFDSENSNFRIAKGGQLFFYSMIHAYDPKEAVAEGKRIFITHFKNSIL